jgi:hypothetical protein
MLKICSNKISLKHLKLTALILTRIIFDVKLVYYGNSGNGSKEFFLITAKQTREIKNIFNAIATLFIFAIKNRS